MDVEEGSSSVRYSYNGSIMGPQTLVSLHRSFNSAVATVHGSRTLRYERGAGGAVINHPQKIGQAYLLTASGWELLSDSLILAGSRDLGVTFDPNSGTTFVAADLTPVQNPANGNLAFLWEEEGGLHASLTTRFLEPAGKDLLIANVAPRPLNARAPAISAVYRNDTLFAVREESWETVVQGRPYMAADVFGTAYPLGAVSAVDESASSLRQLSITPNPSSTNALVSFPPLRGEGSIEIGSLLGDRAVSKPLIVAR